MGAGTWAWTMNKTLRLVCSVKTKFLYSHCLGDRVHLHRHGVGQETRETRQEDQDQISDEETEDEENLQSSRVGFEDSHGGATLWRMRLEDDWRGNLYAFMFSIMSGVWSD